MTFLDRIQRGIRPDGRTVYVGRSERIAADIDARYAAPIVAWETEHETVAHDLTPPQLVRFHVWRATGCSVTDATWGMRAIFIRWAVDHERIGRGDTGS